MELYNELGIDADATQQEIKKAYRIKASVYHPDKNDGCEIAAEQFKKVQHAYEVLSNEDNRAHYDRTGNVCDVKAIYNDALEIITSAMLALVSNNSYERDNYIPQIVKLLENNLRSSREKIEKVSADIEKLKYLIDNTAANEAILRGLTQQLNQMAVGKEEPSKLIPILEKALEIMEEVSYTGIVPTRQAFGGFFQQGGNNSTGGLNITSSDLHI